MEAKRYRVRLVRPVFQVAVVEVEANGEDDAILDALYLADTIPEREWEGSFDPDSYFYDAHYVQEMSEAEDDSLRDDLDEDRKYLLLRGDIDSGTGAVPFQPWLTGISDLMVADLCSDWAAEIADLEQVGVASFYASLGQVKTKNGAPGKVLPFRKPAPATDQDDHA